MEKDDLLKFGAFIFRSGEESFKGKHVYELQKNIVEYVDETYNDYARRLNAERANLIMEKQQMNFTKLEYMGKLLQGILYNQIADNLNIEPVDLNDDQFREDILVMLEELNAITKENPDYEEFDLWTIDAEDSEHTLVRLTNQGEFQKFVRGRGWRDTGVYVKEGLETVKF